MEYLQNVMRRIQLLLFGFISSILIILLGIIGCSDPFHTGSIGSYTGSMLTPKDVDDYPTSIRGGTYCIHNDTDSACINLVPLVKNGVDTKGPIIHIYPERTHYLFYHEGKPIVEVVRIGDTTDIIKTLPESGQDPPKTGPTTPGNNDNNDDGNNGGDDDDDDDNNGDDNNDDKTPAGPNDDDNDNNPDNTDPTNNTSDGHGWLIWIYYPEGTAPINPPTLSKSNVTVTINSKQLTDKDITGFAQFIGADGERGIQFFYPTESAELLDLKVQMIGITDQEGNVRFNINYLWHSY